MPNKTSEKTGKYIGENISLSSKQIAEETVVREKQSSLDFSKFILVIGIVGPILALFQAFKIFSVQSVSGVSMTYWGAYLAIAALWLGYGIYSHNKSISIAYGAWVFVIIIILNGFYFYG